MSSSPSSNDNNIEGIFWERFEELASQSNDVRIVDHTKLQSSLVSSNSFHVGPAQLIIEKMVKSGKINKYRKKSTEEQALAPDSTTEGLPPNN